MTPPRRALDARDPRAHKRNRRLELVAAFAGDDAEKARAPRALFAAYEAWLAEPREIRDIVLLAQRFSLWQRRRPKGALAEAMRRASDGDAPGALKAALRGLAEIPLPGREAARAAYAAVIERIDQRVAARLFEAQSGWRAGDPACAGGLALFANLSRNGQPWLAEALDRALGAAAGALRAPLTEARIEVADRNEADVSRLGEIIARLVSDSGVWDSTGGRAARLVWTTRSYDLAVPLLRRFPDLAGSQLGAWLAAMADGSGGADAGDNPAIARVAAAERDSEALWDRLADPRLRLAVIGNSPCDIGRGLGPEIDGHDMVVRFNLAPEDGSFVADYGARCDVKMLNLAVMAEAAPKTRAAVLLLAQSNAASGDFRPVAAAQALERSLAFVPDDTRRRLTARIGRNPSAGLLLLGRLHEVRGSLAGVSTYGFSLVDQVEDPAATHYFDVARPGYHDWRAERALLDAWRSETAAL